MNIKAIGLGCLLCISCLQLPMVSMQQQSKVRKVLKVAAGVGAAVAFWYLPRIISYIDSHVAGKWVMASRVALYRASVPPMLHEEYCLVVFCDDCIYVRMARLAPWLGLCAQLSVDYPNNSECVARVNDLTQNMTMIAHTANDMPHKIKFNVSTYRFLKIIESHKAHE